ncbi:hypothetical protein HZY91_02945 [Facklamia sp. DSM 111018]|uniref:Uncharacterized protein n=2 Tax=Facklamia lactis TaxID=2749967 RepID=A0ABS0LNV0_9LACT|nr:hypothetical protein [Facklamia lactis]
MIVAAIGPLLMILGGLAMAISFLLTPVGLVVAGVTALVGIIIAAFLNWDSIVKYFSGAWNFFLCSSYSSI